MTTAWNNATRPVILLVEDDLGDQELVKIAIEEAKFQCRKSCIVKPDSFSG